ncbi:hypothetical protein LHL18_10505 [Rheinheimera aquimaris]|uniref:hypothetical protein n=1 Tax=Rheinheimera aquimaris TaxID=412437 RepID=UPI001CFF7378|nr:hypothetical protein [Rheinheimera aquimaris]MCB5213919.1 hypothetical protein [Rheinheimera aquimaris]
MFRFFLLLVLLLTGCSSQVRSIKTDVFAPLAHNQGYVLLGIETNNDLDYILIDGPKRIRLSCDDLRAGTNYLLVDLPAGTYTIEKVRLARYWKFDLDEADYWQFSIEAQKISYVGHFEFVSNGVWWNMFARLELVNRSSEALVFMEQNFPEILSGFNLVYKGPGQDPFFEYMKSGREVL